MDYGFGRGARLQPDTTFTSRILSKAAEKRTWRMQQVLLCDKHAKTFMVRL